MTSLQDLANELGLRPASALDPSATTRAAPPPASAPRELDFVVIDVETACHRVSSICQIGIVGFAGGREVLTYETLVDPQDTFSPFNVRLHGIGPTHVEGQPNFPRLYGTLLEHLGGRITVAHSMFDQGALNAACRIAGVPMIRSRWLDSVKVARHAWPDLPTHRLNALASHLGLEHRHHDALSDARVAGWVIVKAMDHTGIDLDGWMAGPWRKQPGKRARLVPADSGPLFGERVAILGSGTEPDLAAQVAAAGGRLMSGVGTTTTLLVVAGARPFSFAARRSTNYLKAEALIAAGRPLRVLSSAELRAQLSSGAATALAG